MAIETLQPFLTFYRQYKPDAQVSEGKLFEQTFWQTADVLNLIRYREEKNGSKDTKSLIAKSVIFMIILTSSKPS